MRQGFIIFPVVRQYSCYGVLSTFRCFGSVIDLKFLLSEKGLVFKGLSQWSEMYGFALWFSKRFVQRFTALCQGYISIS